MKIREDSVRMQQGVATLAITMLLLLVMSLVALFANRSLIFEQRASANQYRASKAFETAEAGLEWATAMLNDPRGLDAQCHPALSTTSFRQRYLPVDADLALQTLPNSNPACRMVDGAAVCSCAQPGANPDLSGGTGDDPSFAISFEAVAGDPESVRIISRGCTSTSADCIPGAGGVASDATARTSVVLKLRPILRVLPGAALTAGGSVELLGATALRNSDRLTDGVLVEAGGHVIDEGSARLSTLPGSPPADALVANEPSLHALHDEAASGGVFNAFFGMPIEHYQASSMVKIVRGASAIGRANDVLQAVGQGYDTFFASDDLDFGSTDIGSASRPVLIVSQHAVTCSQPCNLYGLVYGDMARREASGATGLHVRGAVITRGDHRQSDQDSIDYDSSTLSLLRQRTALFARLPGSWRDF